MTTSLESLINEIKKDGVEALKNLLMRKEIEQYFVDFKTTECEDYTGKKVLANNDRKNLAKAISGFGNSEGGLLIWGINSHEKINDFANSKKPIKSPEQFSSLINSEVSRLTIPAHPRVENLVIKENENSNEGFVISIIPKYEGLPIQVIANIKGKGRFFMRAGDSFIDIPHPILAGMFGKRPNPHLIIYFTIPKENKNLVKENNALKFSFGVCIQNKGKGIARDIFLNCYSFGNVTTSFELKDQQNFMGYWVLAGFNLISKPEFRMGPEQNANPVVYHCMLKPPFKDGLVFEFLVGADGQVPRKLEIKKSKKELETLYNSFIKDTNFKLVENLLNIPK